METLDFSKPIMQLDGTPYKNADGKDTLMKEVVANNLITCTTFPDVVKIMEWARAVYKNGKVSVDTSDKASLKNIISGLQNMFPIVKEQLLQVFTETK